MRLLLITCHCDAVNYAEEPNHINTDEITASIEQGNPQKHHIDISFIPKLSG